MMHFEGTHPTLRQSPPRRCRSTMATLAPSPAAPAAVTSPAVPAPRTTRLYRGAGSGLIQLGGGTLATSSRLYSSSGSTRTIDSNILGLASMASFPLDLLDDFRDEERKDEQGDGKDDFRGEQASPVAAHPDIPERSDEEGEHEDPHQDSQPGSENIIQEADPGQPHTEVHGGEREVDQAQVEHRRETVALDGIVVFLELVAHERCGHFPSEGPPDPEGGACSGHRAGPDINESLVGAEDHPSERGQQGPRDEQTNPCGIDQDEDHRPPETGHLEETPKPLRRQVIPDGGETDRYDGRYDEGHEYDALDQRPLALLHRWMNSFHGITSRSFLHPAE